MAGLQQMGDRVRMETREVVDHSTQVYQRLGSMRRPQEAMRDGAQTQMSQSATHRPVSTCISTLTTLCMGLSKLQDASLLAPCAAAM